MINKAETQSKRLTLNDIEKMHFRDFEYDPSCLIQEDPVITAGGLMLDDFDPYENKRSNGVSRSMPAFVGNQNNKQSVQQAIRF